MSYKVEFTNKSKPPLYIKDGEFNKQTPITMFGYNATNYGTALWTNLLQYLEHYANPTPPVNAIEGQLWFDKKDHVLKINTGRIIGSAEWVPIKHKPIQDTSKLLLRTGGTCAYDIQLTGEIKTDDQAVTKQYVDDRNPVRFDSASDKYQYNIMIFNGFMTLNGVIPASEFTDGKATIQLPKYMNNANYSVLLTVGTQSSTYTYDVKDPYGHHLYVTDKTTSSFAVNVDTALPSDGEIQLCVIGQIKPAYTS